MILEDHDITRLRYRAQESTRRSRERRRSAPVRDGLSDALLLTTIAALTIALMFAYAIGGGGEAQGAQSAPARGMVDERAERLLRAWCPASMPRRHCVAWMRVAQCETGGGQYSVTATSLRQIRWRYNGSSGYDGALQFAPRTWRASVGRIPARSLTRQQYIERARGRYAFAYDAPPAVQVLAGEALRVRRDGGGLGHWPTCGRRW